MKSETQKIWLWLVHCARLLLCFTALTGSLPTAANECESPQAHLSHEFESGARWTLCWSIDPVSGLNLHKLSYGAPEHDTVQILDTASLGQLTIRYHEDTDATALLPTPGLGAQHHLNDERSNCQPGNRRYNSVGDMLCLTQTNLNTLTSTRRQHALRRHTITLAATSLLDQRWVRQAWHLSEDGDIEPIVSVGGKVTRLTSHSAHGSGIGHDTLLGSTASVVATWRMAFLIDATANDRLEAVEFHLNDDSTRTMQVRVINTETQEQVDRQKFRGWLIRDGFRSASSQLNQTIGYYLDPMMSGYNNNALTTPTPDLMVTRTRPCEVLASGNSHIHASCSDTVSEYGNAERLEDNGITLWYTLTRSMKPDADAFPFWPMVTAQFKLMPFDWTEKSPFKPLPR